MQPDAAAPLTPTPVSLAPVPSAPLSAPATPVKTGRFKRSWALTKSALHALSMDTELMILPVYAAVTSLVVYVLYILAAFYTGLISFTTTSTGTEATGPLTTVNWISIAFGFSLLVLTAFIANYFAAALTFGIITRFKGGNPNIRSSLGGASAHAGAIFMFTLLSSSIGYVLKMAEERLPWAGVIITRLLGAAWAIASMFAIPVIVMSDRHVGPIDATKQSVAVIKRTWGESLIANVGIGIVATLSLFGYFLTIGVAGTLIAGASQSAWPIAIFALLAILGLMFLSLFFNVLSAIVKAAIYHYASTGTAPELFDSEIIKSSFAPKPAR